MITDESKRLIGQQFLEALRSRDWNSLRSILTDDVVWTVPGASLISGVADGVDEVISHAQRTVSYEPTF